MEYDLSVIVPFYGVERYIERCVRSLMEQTVRSGVELIFVDDGSQDRSREILLQTLELYPERKDSILILTSERNQGLPAARNAGLAVARGKYVCHIDSDDYLDPSFLDLLFRKAEEYDADIVYCDFYVADSFIGRRVVGQPSVSSGEEAVRYMLCGKLRYNVWNKIVRRTLYDRRGEIRFPEGHTMGEDTTMILLCACARKIVRIPYPLYTYVRYNPASATSRMNSCAFSDMDFNTRRILSLLPSLGFSPDKILTASFMLLMKWPLLITGQAEDYDRWQLLFPESHDRIMVSAGVCRRIRVVEWLAARGYRSVVRLHYLFVVRVFYSVRETVRRFFKRAEEIAPVIE